MPPISTILFDCDNTLVLSEPLAFAACAELSNAIIAAYAPNITHRYAGPELQREFVGRNFRGLIAALEVKHGFTVPTEDLDGWVGKELGTTIGKIKAAAVPCEGVMPVLESLREENMYNLAIVSSSALPRVLASIETTHQDVYFPPSKVFSAASMVPPTSKPDPAVYLYACQQLGVDPSNSVAIEDSKSGATAANRAGIPLIGYVGPYYEDGQEEVDRMVRLLTEECGAIVIMHHWKDFRECLAVVEGKQQGL
ncbi:hypothetical protein CI109_105901 [Kwoniella shandongensis]|uniref:Uncharacterized protein n=1 Tax=Kwoniella shandongensis TaxID=1734106 RepID=A0A5M6BVM1_9TREE|nr:uncharacterized protein CI109_006669 [Kwoniella shandongensis]KAA5525029.1 hypothetical protein CI109_006669 [Kwoniella shandongensis]